MMRMAWPGATFGGMQAVGRLAGGDPGIIADAGMGVVAAGLIAIAAWGPPPGLIGTGMIPGRCSRGRPGSCRTRSPADI